MTIRREVLTLEPDCWGLGDGCLVDDFKIEGPEGDLVPLEDEDKIDDILRPYIYLECMIMQDGNVYAPDGKYLGTHYI
jgi:hypothetical protein